MTAFKALARDALPKRLQVPVKYWFGFARGELEPEMTLLPMLVARGDHAIDIGGNRGAYAYRLATLGARVSVFEPNPICLAVLEPWAQAKSAITIHPVALSEDTGMAELAIPIDEQGVEHDASASIEHIPSSRVRRQPVAMRPLDSFGIRDAKLIKIDVEGHEGSVVAGAAETIRASMPAMIVEIEQRHIDRPITAIFDQIMAFGYRGYYLDGRKLVAIEGFSASSDQAPEAFGKRAVRYINNFIFLDQARVERGQYEAMLK